MNEMHLSEQKKLVKELNGVSVEAFSKATPIEETWERTINVDYIFLIKKGREIIGYTTNDVMEISGHEVNYFSSALFKKELQYRGTYNHINNLRIDIHPTDFIMTRTQNPKVVKSFRRLCDERGYMFHPSGFKNEHILKIAKEYSSISDDNMICKGVYGRALMDKTPLPDEETKDIFSRINIDDGDAIILIGQKHW